MGIVYQPTFIVADAVADGRLEILELDHPPFDLGSIYAVYPPNEHLPAKVRVFIDFLIKRFAGTPPWQRRIDQTTDRNRSEEHTSELQSLMRISYAVFCLKKKSTRSRPKMYTNTKT